MKELDEYQRFQIFETHMKNLKLSIFNKDQQLRQLVYMQRGMADNLFYARVIIGAFIVEHLFAAVLYALLGG